MKRIRLLLATLGIAAAVAATVLMGPRAVSEAASLPLWGLRSVIVRGNASVAEAGIVAAAGLTTGQNILSVDLAAAAERVAATPRIGACRLSRVLPDRIVIEVVERQPAAVLQLADGFHLADEAGRLLSALGTPQESPSLPLLTAGDAAVTPEEAVTVGLAVARALAEWKGVLPQVSEIVVFAGGEAEVYALDRPLRVVFPAGDAAGAARRWASLGPVLASSGEGSHALDLRHRGRAYLKQEDAGGSQG